MYICLTLCTYIAHYSYIQMCRKATQGPTSNLIRITCTVYNTCIYTYIHHTHPPTPPHTHTHTHNAVIFQPFFTLPTTPFFKYNYTPFSFAPTLSSSPTKKHLKSPPPSTTPQSTGNHDEPKIPPLRPPPPILKSVSTPRLKTGVDEGGEEVGNLRHVKSEQFAVQQRVMEGGGSGEREREREEDERDEELERLKTPSPATGQPCTHTHTHSHTHTHTHTRTHTHTVIFTHSHTKIY